jgi:LysR family carnitine catabolism transcriptional activator
MKAIIKQLKVFVAVAPARNFAEAGSRVHLSQPALSIAIKKFGRNSGWQVTGTHNS